MSDNSLNPTSLSIPQVSQLLSLASGRAVTEKMLEQDVADGAPTNADGTLNLVHYAAWLVQEMGHGD